MTTRTGPIPRGLFDGIARALVPDRGPARANLAALDADEAEAARQLAVLGLVAAEELDGDVPIPGASPGAPGLLAIPRADRVDLYLRIADRRDDATAALRSLDDRQAAAFRRVAIETLTGILAGVQGLGDDRDPAAQPRPP